MKVAIITDTHYGARKGSKFIHDYFELFYDDVFFPTLEKEGITTVIHMGDTFDSRKSIDYQSLEWSKRVVFDRLKPYDVHMIVGNHDTYYKNTNDINSPDLLLQTYNNIKTYGEATEVNIGGLDILFLPWINQDNQDETFKTIKKTFARSRWGTLNSQDLELIDKSSWSMVWMANYLRSSPMSTPVTITLDRLMDGYFISGTHTKCSGLMWKTHEDSRFSILSRWRSRM